jgi:hypothetical protein
MDTQERVTRVEEKLTALTGDVGEIKAGMAVQTTMLRALMAAEERRKGALAALGRVGALVGSGGGLTALIAWITGHVK